MSEQDGKIVNLGGLKKFKEYYDTDIITPINNKIDSKTNAQNGEIITTNNDTIGYFKNIKINGNTRYKKSDGTYTDTWESGVTLESIGEKEKDSNGKYPITIKSIDNSKNLIEKSNIITGYYYDENNTLQPNPNMNTLKKLINVKSGATYYIKNSSNTSTNVTYILYFTETNTLIKCEYDKNIVTIPDNCVKIRFSGSNLNKLCFSLNNFYSEYKEDKRTVLLDSPLRKNDVLDLEKLKITRNYGSATFNGEEEWAVGVEHTNTILFDKTLGNSKPNYIMCDKFIYNTSIWGVDTEGCRISNNGSIQINISKSKLETQDVAGFKKWLQSNPVTVVYQLATPTTEDIEVSSNTLTDFTTSCTLTIDNTIKGNIECNEVVGLIPSVEEDRTRLTNLETDNTTNKSNITNLQNSLGNKAEKNHNHDNVYSKLEHKHNYAGSSTAGGSATSAITSNFTGVAWTTTTQVGTWSALCLLQGYVSIMFSIDMDQRNQCNHDVFLINTGWDKARIIQLSGNGYYENTEYQLRLVKESSNQYTLELKNDYVHNEAKTLNVKCKYITINNNSEGSVAFYNSFTPSTNKSVPFSITTSSNYIVGTISNAIKDSEGNIIKDTYVKQDEEDMTVLFERNNGTINKNINTYFNSSSGNFTAPETGQYLIMCSGYELSSSSSEYVACVLDSSSSNQNKLYTTGSSGFTLITLNEGQTLAIYTATAGNMNKTCISSNSAVNMLIARIK